MEKTEAIVLIIVILAGVIGMFYVYGGVGKAYERKNYCMPDTDITFRMSGGLMQPESTLIVDAPKKPNECNYRILSQMPEQGVESFMGRLTLTEVVGGKATFMISDMFGGVYYTDPLEAGDIWSNELMAIKVKDIDTNRGVVVARYLSTIQDICEKHVWDIDSKRRVCARWTSPAEIGFRLRSSTFG